MKSLSVSQYTPIEELKWSTELALCPRVSILAAIRPYSIPMSAMLDGNSNWATLDNGDTGPSISNKSEEQCDGKSPGGKDGWLIWSTLLFPSIQSTYTYFVSYSSPVCTLEIFNTSPLFWIALCTCYRNLLYFAIKQFRIKSKAKYVCVFMCNTATYPNGRW